ncbi:hypothetical protein ACIBO4_34900 [Streptomyces sp. NPDC050149]|uniref:hypothetical protein n=1 Tax=Streptomyces sp. NPDC050149 TaxID=3365603 RepID=UPI0037AFB3DC
MAIDEAGRDLLLPAFKNPNVSPAAAADLKSTSWVREGLPPALIGGSGTGGPTC